MAQFVGAIVGEVIGVSLLFAIPYAFIWMIFPQMRLGWRITWAILAVPILILLATGIAVLVHYM